jgi:hypothetical protein
MSTGLVIWLAMRALRWLLWIGFFAYNAHYLLYRSQHIDQFGHLLITTELAMFGLGVAAVFAGMLELMLRERTGLPRPKFGHLIPAGDKIARPDTPVS